MASMTGRSPDVPGIIPNISRSVADRSRSRAGGRSADGGDDVGKAVSSYEIQRLTTRQRQGCQTTIYRALIGIAQEVVVWAKIIKQS